MNMLEKKKKTSKFIKKHIQLQFTIDISSCCTGSSLNNIATPFPTDNIHHFTLPCASTSNHSDKSTTFPSTTTQMANGFISFANTTDGNLFTQQSSTKT
ncbi:unnamed protein product [Rotaria sordida]|uniref:Uncharacterized protein n=1 Tax=Rotaria sordida TaxID=392033 RepID=A0A814FAE2_9BILA|nr:unnamed protein product [Rotaria sordida]